MILTSASDGNFTPRAGDAIAGEAVVPVRLPLADSLDTVDLTDCHPIKTVETKVIRGGQDSLYLTLAGSSRLLHIAGDTVAMLSEGQRGLFFDCVVPEPELRGAPSPYYRCGTAGGIDFREYGTFSISEEPIARFIPAENDTLTEACLVRSIHTGSLNIVNETLPADWLIMVAGEDSVAQALEQFSPLTDSICKITVRESIYATGFRYPMFIQDRCILYADGVAVDSASCAFIFPPDEIARLDDPENEELRNRDTRQGFRPAPKNSPTHSSSLTSSGLSLSASPSVTDGNTTVTVGIETPCAVSIEVSNAAGAVIFHDTFNADPGGLRTRFDFRPYPAGIYLISASDGKEVRTVKIAKI